MYWIRYSRDLFKSGVSSTIPRMRPVREGWLSACTIAPHVEVSLGEYVTYTYCGWLHGYDRHLFHRSGARTAAGVEHPKQRRVPKSDGLCGDVRHRWRSSRPDRRLLYLLRNEWSNVRHVPPTR